MKLLTSNEIWNTLEGFFNYNYEEKSHFDRLDDQGVDFKILKEIKLSCKLMFAK